MIAWAFPSTRSFGDCSGMTGMTPNIQHLSKRIAEHIEEPSNEDHRAIIAQAGRFGGWSFYVENGVPAYAYNWLGIEIFTVSASEPVTEGTHEIVLDFDYDGGSPGKGGTAPSLLTRCRWHRAGPTRCRPSSFRRTKQQTLASTFPHRWPKRTAPKQLCALPAR